MKKGKEWLKDTLEAEKADVEKRYKDTADDNHRSYTNGHIVAFSVALKHIDKLEEPKKPIIPQFVAEAFEKAKGDNVYAEYLINSMYDSSDEVGYWLEVPSNEKLLLRAWLDDSYEIKKEKLYVVVLSNSNGKFSKFENFVLNKGDGVVFIDSCQLIVNDIKKYSQFALTEKEIKDYDERFWPFAVEVAE